VGGAGLTPARSGTEFSIRSGRLVHFHRGTEHSVHIGLIGLGAIGQQVAAGIASGAAGPDVELTGVLTRGRSNSITDAGREQLRSGRHVPREQLRSGTHVAREQLRLVTDLSSLLATGPHLVVEAASADAVVAYAEPILASGASLVVASSAALVESAFRARLEELCRLHNVRVYVPAGALIGLDALSAAAAGELEAVSLCVVEPLRGCEARRVIFQGSAVEAARQFPGRLNIAATAALALGAFDASVTLIECPPDDRHEIVLSARGAFGEFTASLWPDVRADRLRHIVALSLLARVRRMQADLQIG
jgi:aspartate dehydrogenase